MKKLFIMMMLLPTLAFGQLDFFSPTFNTNDHKPKAGTIIDQWVDWNNDSNRLTALSFTMSESYKTNHNGSNVTDFINFTMSSGCYSCPVVTDNGNGSVTVPAGYGFIREGTNVISSLYFFGWNADTNVTLTDNVLNYLYVDYNSNNPIISNTLDITTLDHTSQFILSFVYREGTDLHITAAGQELENFIHKLYRYSWEYDGIQRVDGLVTSEIGTNHIVTTAGTLYWALNRIVIDAFDSRTNTFGYYYRDGDSGWTGPISTNVIDNTYYDDNSGTLNELTVNRYGVHWIYTVTDGDMYAVYGQDDYRLSEAQAATAPASLPRELSSIGVLIAKIIIQKSDTSFISITLPWTSSIGFSAATDHNGLANLQGGAASDYSHWLAVQQTDLTDAGDSALHYHLTDRNRTNHIGMQLSSTISDFDSRVPTNTTVNSNSVHRATTSGNPHNVVAGDIADISSNTTHRTGDGKTHSDVILNNTHRPSDGSDHGFIDQNITSGSSPILNILNFTGTSLVFSISATNLIGYLQASNFSNGVYSITSTNAQNFNNQIPAWWLDLTNLTNFHNIPTNSPTADYVIKYTAGNNVRWAIDNNSGGGGGGSSTSVCFRVYKAANWTVSASSVSKVAVDVEAFDNGADFDLGGNVRFDAPSDGIYMFSTCADDNFGISDSELYKNGSPWLKPSYYSGDINSGPIELSSGDYIEWYIRNNSGGTRTYVGSSTNNWFAGLQLQ